MTSFPPCDKTGHVSLHEPGTTPSKYMQHCVHTYCRKCYSYSYYDGDFISFIRICKIYQCTNTEPGYI